MHLEPNEGLASTPPTTLTNELEVVISLSTSIPMPFGSGEPMEVEDDVDEVPRQVLITAAIVFDNFTLLLHLFTFNDDDDPGPL